jgi:hypothetical protein
MGYQKVLRTEILGSSTNVVIDNMDRIYTYNSNNGQIMIVDSDNSVSYINDYQNSKYKSGRFYINANCGTLVFANGINHYCIDTKLDTD